jgi:hypothetical protein
VPIGMGFLGDRFGIGFAIQFVARIAITSRIFVLMSMHEKKTKTLLSVIG